MGVCSASPEIAPTLVPGDHGSTFGGGPVQCAAALAVIEVIEHEGLVERAAEAGERLMKGLESVIPSGASVRGKGLMVAIVIEGSAHLVAQRCFERGVLVNDIGDDIVRLLPPLIITDEEIDRAVDVIKEVSDEI